MENYKVVLSADEGRFDRISEYAAELLEELSYRFSEGRSFSIKTENAQKILASVLFAINLSGDTNLQTRDSFRLAYQKGLDAIEAHVTKAKTLYKEVKQTAVKTALKSYKEMLEKGIEQFFRMYDKVFAASEIPADIDYFLMGNNQKLQGVLYMCDFLHCLLQENRFCQFYDSLDIEKLLEAFGDGESQVYNELHPNIFDLVFTNSMLSVLLGNKPEEILLNTTHEKLLESRFACADSVKVNEMMEAAVESIMEHWGISADPSLVLYIMEYVEKNLKPLVALANENGNIKNTAVYTRENTDAQEIELVSGKKMSDKEFRKVVTLIYEENDISGKLEIVKNNISSLVDFIDLFKADAFYGDEIFEVFKILDENELKILAENVFYDYKKGEDFGEYLKTADSHVKWEQQFIEFLRDKIL